MPTRPPTRPTTQPPLSPTTTDIADRDAEELFFQNKVPVFRLSLPDERFEQLEKDALLEEYVDAQLEYEGVTIGEVGLRYKGSYGSLENCFDDDGRRICDKLSMKIKFNEVDKDLRFYGLKKLNFHSMKQDRSKIADKISYKVFRDAGIAAPRSSWARLEVNGESLGLFALVEQIDGRFTKDRFEEGDGDLYKEAWPKRTDTSYYDKFIKTNEDEATHDKITRFAQAMENAAPEDRLEILDEWTSLDAMYTFMAAQDAVAQWDGVTAWYCHNGDMDHCSNHNFYIYSQETTDHFTWIPWDMDSTMIPTTAMDHVPHWTVTDVDCNQGYDVWDGGATVRAPDCDPILAGLASDMGQYSKAVDALLVDAFDIEKIASDIDTYVEFIRDEVESDQYGGSFDDWLRAVERVKEGLPVLKLRLESHRNGDSGLNHSPLGLVSDTTNTFEAVSDLAVAFGVITYANEETSFEVSANRSGPLSGAVDIRLDFDYRDGSNQWSHGTQC